MCVCVSQIPHFNERGMLVPYYDFLFVCLIWGESYEKTWQPVNLFQFRFSLFVVSLRPQLFEKQLVTEMFQDDSEIKSRRLQITSQHRERETVSELSQVIYVKNKTKLDKSQSSDITILNVQYSISFNKHDRHILINNIYIPNIFPLLGIS